MNGINKAMGKVQLLTNEKAFKVRIYKYYFIVLISCQVYKDVEDILAEFHRILADNQVGDNQVEDCTRILIQLGDLMKKKTSNYFFSSKN